MMKYNLLAMFIAVMCLTSCTLSFHNIDTHGPSSDLVDDNLSTDPKIDIPLINPVK